MCIRDRACSSRFATVKLGAADEKPEFSFFAWVAMLFCAALGTGFVIFGAAEPLYHLFTAPTVMDAGSAGAVRGVPEAIRLSVVNWGLSLIHIYRRTRRHCRGYGHGMYARLLGAYLQEPFSRLRA